MGQADSIDKIAETYFGSVCTEPFTYKGKTYQPKRLRVSPLLFRGFVCPAGCGGCCKRYSMDYLPFEAQPHDELKHNFEWREVVFNDKPYKVYSDMQKGNTDYYCRYLDKTNGRCGIYTKPANAFSCDFELIRFLKSSDPEKHDQLTHKLFGRGWAMLRIDGERGAKCYMTEPTPESVADIVRKLTRLKGWCNYFEIRNKVDDIIAWAKDGPKPEPLMI